MTNRIESPLPRLLTLFRLFMLTALLLGTGQAQADPADIDAAARGVVRVLIIERNEDDLMAVSHGTGFAVSPERIVTNAHVIQEARNNPDLSIGIVPSEGGNAVYARVVAVSPRNDLALLATTSPMNLPPLTIAGEVLDSGAVSSVGYPQNVDRAQGLGSSDIFRPQPPVKSTGFLAGRRPSREFDTLLHTAPIARGNSGGPLLDECGRVTGVNSFGAQSGGSDAEFFFAVSTRELLPFLRANGITPRVNALPCRSIAELDAAERERAGQAAQEARQKAAEQEEVLARRRDEAQRDIEFAVLAERENGMALAGLLLLLAFGAGAFAFIAWEREARTPAMAAGGLAALAILGAGYAWLSRPDFGAVAERLEHVLRREMVERESVTSGVIEPAGTGALACTLDLARSRIISEADESLTLDWSAEGCADSATQFGRSGDDWLRVMVPESEDAVSVQRFDPQTGEYRVDRYLLSRERMQRIRQAREGYEAPECRAGAAAAGALGTSQNAVLSLLPDRPNERLAYTCAALPAAPSEPASGNAQGGETPPAL
ncbi:S1 family peptidase [Altericroceibacterium xinjiangense]|uniref:S1 family peptidase n=1 Tax=Altericroceibacterium xinjiangense TaxID=762261 RepID=UPI001F49DC9D|nr:serine protease [Altericroceibacterium xinjiangense]